jgi:hypothetical protein
VFAKAPTQSEYETMVAEENKIVKARCFVVTATMGSATHPIVTDMRRFSDEVLSTNCFGSRLINQYNVHGPRLADKIARNNHWRMLCYIFVVRPAHIGVRLIFVWRDFLAGRNG